MTVLCPRCWSGIVFYCTMNDEHTGFVPRNLDFSELEEHKPFSARCVCGNCLNVWQEEKLFPYCADIREQLQTVGMATGRYNPGGMSCDNCKWKRETETDEYRCTSPTVKQYHNGEEILLDNVSERKCLEWEQC